MKMILMIVFLLDLFDFSFMEFMDTTVPINTLAWFVIWLAFGLTND